MKNNIIIIILILFISIIVFGFYWYEWRPSEIRKNCYKEYQELELKIKLNIDYDDSYKSCLRKNGLKDY